MFDEHVKAYASGKRFVSLFTPKKRRVSVRRFQRVVLLQLADER